jgi:hypothetical protein
MKQIEWNYPPANQLIDNFEACMQRQFDFLEDPQQLKLKYHE